MKAMILAAGRGERMRPLTDHTPKPLIDVLGRPLIVHHIEHLRSAGFTEIVINTGWLGTQLPARLGDGAALGVHITWSIEGWPAFETAGGIATALEWLGPEPFLVVNGDVFTDYPFAAVRGKLAADCDAHLVLVDNPEHHPKGDFALVDGRLSLEPEQLRLTFSGIGLYRPAFFAGVPQRQAGKLAPLLFDGIAHQRISGEHYAGLWTDVGTPERLAALEQRQADV